MAGPWLAVCRRKLSPRGQEVQSHQGTVVQSSEMLGTVDVSLGFSRKCDYLPKPSRSYAQLTGGALSCILMGWVPSALIRQIAQGPPSGER